MAEIRILLGLGWVWLLLVGSGQRAMAGDVSLSEFFRPGPEVTEKYAADKVYPQGRIFPLTMYSTGGGGKVPADEMQAALRRAKSDGFTMIGPQYELNDRVIADAKAHGLKAFYTVGMSLDFHGKKPPAFTPADVEREIGKQVRAVAEHPEIAWWYLQPEELRHWRKNEMTYMGVAVRTICRADPLKRPVWMYDPGHRTAEGLAHTVKYLGVCGKGIYTNYSGQRDSRIWVRWSIEQELGAIRKANPSAIAIAVPEMFQQPDDAHLPMIRKWVRHDVYLSLVTGAKGIVVFSMRKRPKFTAHQAYYDAYASAARELCGEIGLGQVFLFGEKRGDIKVEIVEGPRHISPTEGKGGIKAPAKKYAPISILDVAYGKGRYLFAVNSANVPVRGRVTGLPTGKLSAHDLFADAEPMRIDRGAFELAFEPLAVKAFRFEQGP